MTLAYTKSRKIALAAVFAAVYFVLRSLPVFQMIGISGRFTAGDFLLTTIALVVGLWGGMLAIIVGTVLAYPVNGPIFLGLDFLPAAMNVLVTGLILQNHRRIAQAMFLVVLLAFLISPYSLPFGYGYVPYTWLHIIALLALLSPVIVRFPDWLTRSDTHQVFAIAILAFIGTMIQHLTGGLLYELTVGLVQGTSPAIIDKSWQFIFWLYPMERLAIIAISTIISVGLLRSVKRLYV